MNDVGIIRSHLHTLTPRFNGRAFDPLAQQSCVSLGVFQEGPLKGNQEDQKRESKRKGEGFFVAIVLLYIVPLPFANPSSLARLACLSPNHVSFLVPALFPSSEAFLSPLSCLLSFPFNLLSLSLPPFLVLGG